MSQADTEQARIVQRRIEAAEQVAGELIALFGRLATIAARINKELDSDVV